MDTGIWSIYEHVSKNIIYIGQEDSEREIFLQIHGNFESKEAKLEYAEMLLKVLNGCIINIRKVE